MTDTPHTPSDLPTVHLANGPLSIDDLVRLARGQARVALSDTPAVRERIERSAEMVRLSLEAGRPMYGVSTGYGASAEFEVTADVAAAMPLNLLRYHGCGTGRPLSPEGTAAVMVARAVSLAQGKSGVRAALVERLCELVNRRVLPLIPEEGSVGASGDLTPLSYVAALLVGEREVWAEGGGVEDAGERLRREGLDPLVLRPKEALAVLNGTSVMAALGCLAWERARRLGQLACLETAMASSLLRGPAEHFDDRIFASKPHPGQRAAARWIRESLPTDGADAERIQDPYSIRCSPHVVGVLLDALPFTRGLLETELNGVSDNPLLDPEADAILHGGNFYGGHACLATDTLKNVVANVADLLERQMVLLCNPATSAGLPANLVGRAGDDRFTHHGFKGMEITASALTAEALKLAGPTSVFSRSTESHNQDKVSMGTISAREALRILELTETVAAIHLLALCQAVDLRGPGSVGERARAVWKAVRAEVPKHDVDRRMDGDIAAVLGLLRAGRLPLGEADFS